MTQPSLSSWLHHLRSRFGRETIAAHGRRRAPAFHPEFEPLEDRLVPANATVAGALSFPYPTLNSISIDWLISGDDNNNAVATVQYRAQGSSTWLQAMNLVRIPAGTNTAPDGSGGGVSWANQLTGSILDLQPNTTYQIQLSLTDPDGGSTSPAIQTVTTRAVPTLTELRTIAVNPSNFASALAAAQPGDVLDLAAGTYNGPFYASNDGTAANPIVIMSSSGGAIIQGDGTNAIDLSSHNYYHLDGLQINNGRIKLNGAIGSAVTRCTIHTPGDGIVAYMDGNGNAPQSLYIADNYLYGASIWDPSELGNNGVGTAILLAGPGHSVVNNYIHGFNDGITLDDGELSSKHDVDILNNDIDTITDDAIEPDWTQGNIRVMYNRVTNVFDAFSSQPAFGGPSYFIRNVVYNSLYTPFKLQNDSVGNIILNNTSVKSGDAFPVIDDTSISQSLFANNLFIGGPGDYLGNNGRVIDLQTADGTDSFWNNAFGDTSGTFQGKIQSNFFSTLAGLNGLPNVHNEIQVGLSVFAAGVTLPNNSPLGPELAAPDLRLAAGSAAVDAGMVIPNVTDGYTGAAPDIGAYEFGAALPVYGPRPLVSPPAAPTNLVASAGNGQVGLSWAASAGATRYNVYRGTTSGGEAWLTQVTGTSYTDAGLTDGTAYYYEVTAVNTAGESAASSEVNATPQATSQQSTTALASSANPSVYGQSITLTATVTGPAGSGTPTGSVLFMDGTNPLGSASLNSSGVATLSASLTTVGTHALTAFYSGDSSFNGSSSAALSQSVKKAASLTTLSSSAAPSVFGQSVTFTASVSAVSPGSGTPTGSFTFYNNGVVLGTATVGNNGVAVFTTSGLAVGSHTIKASYAGDSHFTSSSKSISQTVKKDSTKVTASPTTAVRNQAVTLVATVKVVSPGSGMPTGTVTFKDTTTATVLGTATLVNGTATLSNVTFTTLGKHRVSVSYSGDVDDLASSMVLVMTVGA